MIASQAKHQGVQTMILGGLFPLERPVMLACSVSKDGSIFMQGRALCSDRQGFLETMKIGMQQFTTIFANYYSDQLKEDLERDEKIQNGEMTRAEANLEDEEWQEREWNSRMDKLPNRLVTAFFKYHAIVLVMRTYEVMAERFVTMERLDKLTLDTFAAAKRERNSPSLFSKMVDTCWQANLIGYFADYSVHQIILCYGYYLFVQDKRRRLKGEVHSGSVALNFLRKSTLLLLSRGFGLAMSSLGGAVGSLFLPGWGTLMGVNLGDSFAFTVSEEIQSPSPPSE